MNNNKMKYTVGTVIAKINGWNGEGRIIKVEQEMDRYIIDWPRWFSGVFSSDYIDRQLDTRNWYIKYSPYDILMDFIK